MSTKLLLKDLERTRLPVTLIFESYEGSLYQTFARQGDTEQLVWQDQKNPIKTYCLTEMRERFQHIKAAQRFLRQRSAYDEMIGQVIREGENTLLIPLSGAMPAADGELH